MVANVPGTRVLSEPWCLHDIHFLYSRKEISEEDLEPMLRASLGLLLKPSAIHGYSNVLIKQTPFCLPHIDLYQKLMPRAKHLLLTRNVKSSVKVNTKCGLKFQLSVSKLLPVLYQDSSSH